MHFLSTLNSLNDIHCNEDNQTRNIVNCNVDICDNIKEYNIIVLPVQNEIFQILPNENIKFTLFNFRLFLSYNSERKHELIKLIPAMTLIILEMILINLHGNRKMAIHLIIE